IGIVFQGGDGDDTLDITGSTITGKVKVDHGLGKGSTIVRDFSSVGGKIDVAGLDGDQSVVVQSDTTVGVVNLKFGGGQNGVTIGESAIVTGKVTVTSGD